MKGLAPLDPTSLRLRVYAALQTAIITGELAPGARLRDQELAARLGVSRTPVREALQQLEAEGLVATAPRAATRVMALGAPVARDAFPVVAALHALATRLAVPRLTPSDLTTMRGANEQLAALIAQPAADAVFEAIGADDRFHAVLLAACGNAEIPRALDRLMPKIRRLEYAHFGSLAGRASVQLHLAILGACERADAAAAAALVEENWMSLGRLIVAVLEDDTGAAPPRAEDPRAASPRAGRV